MMYMKRFPEKREPFYWNILTCELAGTHQSSSEIDRKILRPLAYGFLSKALADVPLGKVNPPFPLDHYSSTRMLSESNSQRRAALELSVA